MRSLELALHDISHAIDEPNQRFIVGRDFLFRERCGDVFERSFDVEGRPRRCWRSGLGDLGRGWRRGRRRQKIRWGGRAGQWRGLQIVFDNIENPIRPNLSVGTEEVLLIGLKVAVGVFE